MSSSLDSCIPGGQRPFLCPKHRATDIWSVFNKYRLKGGIKERKKEGGIRNPLRTGAVPDGVLLSQEPVPGSPSTQEGSQCLLTPTISATVADPPQPLWAPGLWAARWSRAGTQPSLATSVSPLTTPTSPDTQPLPSPFSLLLRFSEMKR